MSGPPSREERIRAQLAAALSPIQLEIQDDSHLHAGHAGAKGGGHFTLSIVSEAFAGKSTLERHRMVYAALGELMQNEVHALSIASAKSPDET